MARELVLLEEAGGFVEECGECGGCGGGGGGEADPGCQTKIKHEFREYFALVLLTRVAAIDRGLGCLVYLCYFFGFERSELNFFAHPCSVYPDVERSFHRLGTEESR